MENASKALIMAAAALIAVGLISIFIYVLTAIGDYNSQKQVQLQSNKVIAANRFFVESAYDIDSSTYGVQIYGYDVYNIMRKVEDINNDPDGELEIFINSDYSQGSFLTSEGVLNKEMLEAVFTYSYNFDGEGHVNSVTFY